MRTRVLWQTDQGREWTAMLLFEPRDLWVGVFWDREELIEGWQFRCYICLLPCLPLLVRREPAGAPPF